MAPWANFSGTPMRIRFTKMQGQGNDLCWTARQRLERPRTSRRWPTATSASVAASWSSRSNHDFYRIWSADGGEVEQ
jgi:hypothetical protein